MNGYDKNFLGVELPLPIVSPSRSGDVLVRQELNQDGIAAYPTYAVLTDKRLRAPIYSVLHIDQNQLKKVERTNNWKIDSRIGEEYQLDNSYYTNNPWDRGHMARRESAAWGDTERDAKKASDETFYYSNACLQHENVNQDEWLALEDWVLSLNLTDNGRVTVFAGPVYGDFSRTIEPSGKKSAKIPSAFFKVVCFMDKAQQLDVRAFLMYQDQEAMRDKNGRKTFRYQKYQVTITEIEKLTGLDFPDEVYEKNPLFYDRSNKAEDLDVTIFPERIDIDRPKDIVSRGMKRTVVADDAVEVYISAALVKPSDGASSEWVSILNLEAESVDVTGWKLEDKSGNQVTLNGVIPAGESKTFKGESLRPLRLPDSGGLIILYDNDSRQIDRVDYTIDEVKETIRRGNTNLPISFMTFRSNYGI